MKRIRMTSTLLRLLATIAAIALLLALPARQAGGVTIGDITRTKGSESNYITGIGIVTGLNDTGDTGASAKRVVQQLINRGLLDGTASLEEFIKAKSAAIVSISCHVPPTGCREGDMLDLIVSTLGDAESLAGGRLETMFLMAPNDPTTPAAQVLGTNPLVPLNEENPTVARAPKSSKMLIDVRTQLLDTFGRIHLVIDEHHASYGNAHLMASTINDVYAAEEGMPDIAKAVDEKNITLSLPVWERENPVAFISPVLRQEVPEELLIGKAVVAINRNKGVIIISGNTKVKPMAVSIQGVTFQQITPPIEPTPVTPFIQEQSFQAIDPSGLGGADLKSLVDTFSLLGIDIDQQIAVIEAMHAAGMFHAELRMIN